MLGLLVHVAVPVDLLVLVVVTVVVTVDGATRLEEKRTGLEPCAYAAPFI